MNTQDLGGSSYYFVLIDDYIRKTWWYFLKENYMEVEEHTDHYVEGELRELISMYYIVAL